MRVGVRHDRDKGFTLQKASTPSPRTGRSVYCSVRMISASVIHIGTGLSTGFCGVVKLFRYFMSTYSRRIHAIRRCADDSAPAARDTLIQQVIAGSFPQKAAGQNTAVGLRRAASARKCRSYFTAGKYGAVTIKVGAQSISNSAPQTSNESRSQECVGIFLHLKTRYPRVNRLLISNT